MVKSPAQLAASLIDANPIARAELDHINHFVRAHPRRRWIVMVLVLLGGIASAVSFGFSLIDTGLGQIVSELRAFYPVIALATSTFFLHYLLLYRLLNLAGESVVREKRRNNWETLVLTGISGRRFVTGKWFAVLHAVWQEVLILAIFRAVLCIGLGYTLFSGQVINLLGMPSMAISLPVAQAAVAMLLIVMFTAINAAFTVAAGVAASFVAREDGASGQTAMAVRMAALLTPVCVIVGTALFYLYEIAGLTANETIDVMSRQVSQIVGFSQFSLLDNGSVITGMLASPYSNNGGVLLASALIALVIYAALTVMLLYVAAWLAHKQGMEQAEP